MNQLAVSVSGSICALGFPGKKGSYMLTALMGAISFIDTEDDYGTAGKFSGKNVQLNYRENHFKQ